MPPAGATDDPEGSGCSLLLKAPVCFAMPPPLPDSSSAGSVRRSSIRPRLLLWPSGQSYRFGNSRRDSRRCQGSLRRHDEQIALVFRCRPVRFAEGSFALVARGTLGLRSKARLDIMSVAIRRLLEGALGRHRADPPAGEALSAGDAHDLLERPALARSPGVLMPPRYELRSGIASYRSKGRGFPCALRALF
jgi:hypothetical protein